jgi:hypothetical protein
VFFKLVELISQFIRPKCIQRQPSGDYDSRTFSAKVKLSTTGDLFHFFHWRPFFGTHFLSKCGSYGPLVLDQSHQQLLRCQLEGVHLTWQGSKARLMIHSLAMLIHSRPISRNTQSNPAVVFSSTFRTHALLMQLMRMHLFIRITSTCSRHGIRLWMLTSRLMLTIFGEHAIGLKSFYSTTFSKSWKCLEVVAKSFSWSVHDLNEFDSL